MWKGDGYRPRLVEGDPLTPPTDMRAVLVFELKLTLHAACLPSTVSTTRPSNELRSVYEAIWKANLVNTTWGTECCTYVGDIQKTHDRS